MAFLQMTWLGVQKLPDAKLGIFKNVYRMKYQPVAREPQATVVHFYNTPPVSIFMIDNTSLISQNTFY
jgi:hypothetical protein